MRNSCGNRPHCKDYESDSNLRQEIKKNLVLSAQYCTITIISKMHANSGYIVSFSFHFIRHSFHIWHLTFSTNSMGYRYRLKMITSFAVNSWGQSWISRLLHHSLSHPLPPRLHCWPVPWTELRNNCFFNLSVFLHTQRIVTCNTTTNISHNK